MHFDGILKVSFDWWEIFPEVVNTNQNTRNNALASLDLRTHLW